MDTWVLPALLGLGLAAASGFRTFLPLLMLSAAARFELFGIHLNESFAWVGSTAALVTLAIAAGAELTADLIPFVDNALSIVGNFIGPIAGVIAAGSVFTDLDPTTAAVAGIIIGAPTALAFSTTQTGLRAASTATTGGAGNPVLSIVEDVGTFLLALLALVLPILVPVALALLIFGVWRLIRRFRRRRLRAAA